MLSHTGLITGEDCDQIVQTLNEIRAEIESGTFAFDASREDIHMHVEATLIHRLGDVGRKLHTGRSRNDQVSNDLRLWVRDGLDRVGDLLTGLQACWLGFARRHDGVILPGYTHLQRAQPILAVHYALAYVEKLHRDRERLAECRKRVNVLGLGAAALAGTSLPIDREFVARELGFEAVGANSLDISSDRDFVVEAVFVLTLIAGHLSGWAEEWVIWSTREFGFLELPDAVCTGSSIMPQKKNPDVCELIRGKSARVVGDLTSLLVLTKALPLAYNRDLQEDKRPLFDAFETVEACLDLAAVVVGGANLNVEHINKSIDQGFLDATTLMEWLILRGVPQRTAHEVIGKLVAVCEERGCRLEDLNDEDFRAAHTNFNDSSFRGSLGIQNAIAAFRSSGSTGVSAVLAQLESWRGRLKTCGENHV